MFPVSKRFVYLSPYILLIVLIGRSHGTVKSPNSNDKSISSSAIHALDHEAKTTTLSGTIDLSHKAVSRSVAEKPDSASPEPIDGSTLKAFAELFARELVGPRGRREQQVGAAAKALWETSSPQSQPDPLLITEIDSTRAIALDSITFKGEPFNPTNFIAWNPGLDRQTRLTFFVLNIGAAFGDNDASSITADAEDSNHSHYPLLVEKFGELPVYSGLNMVVVRLAEGLATTGDVLGQNSGPKPATLPVLALVLLVVDQRMNRHLLPCLRHCYRQTHSMLRLYPV